MNNIIDWLTKKTPTTTGDVTFNAFALHFDGFLLSFHALANGGTLLLFDSTLILGITKKQKQKKAKKREENIDVGRYENGYQALNQLQCKLYFWGTHVDQHSLFNYAKPNFVKLEARLLRWRSGELFTDQTGGCRRFVQATPI